MHNRFLSPQFGKAESSSHCVFKNGVLHASAETVLHVMLLPLNFSSRNVSLLSFFCSFLGLGLRTLKGKAPPLFFQILRLLHVSSCVSRFRWSLFSSSSLVLPWRVFIVFWLATQPIRHRGERRRLRERKKLFLAACGLAFNLHGVLHMQS